MLMFTEAKLCAVSRANTRSKPAIWSDTKLRVHGDGPGLQIDPSKRENTCTAMMSAPRATPEEPGGASPAAIPATWVPWSHEAV